MKEVGSSQIINYFELLSVKYLSAPYEHVVEMQLVLYIRFRVMNNIEYKFHRWWKYSENKTLMGRKSFSNLRSIWNVIYLF